MPEGLRMADGTPVDVEAAERQFEAAMAAPDPGRPAEPPDYPAPPRRDYGLTADGSRPKQAQGRPRKTDADRPRTGKAPASGKPGGGRAAAAPLPDRKAGVDGILQITAGVLVAFPGTRADAGALALHGENLSTAVVATADSDERFGAALDRLLHTGPYAALVMAVVPLAAQVLANHGVVPKGFLGTEDPAALRAKVESELEGEQEKAAAAA